MAYSDMKSAFVWDASQSLRLLYNISKLARSEKDSNFALVNIRSLAERFHNRAIDPNYQTSLTVEQKSVLEKEFATYADWVQCVKLKKDLNQQHLQNTIELQISILQIVRYVLIKTSVCHSRDYYWSRNAVKLALETAISCFDAKRLSEMEWCLNEAAFYQLHYSRQTSEFPVQLLAPYLFDSYLLGLLWMMWMYSTKTSYEVFSRYISTLDSIELTVQQSVIITRMCYNIALEHFKLNDYKVAFFWFKCSYRCAKLLTTGKNGHKSSGKALFLMAVSLFKANVLENRDQILNILNCSGTGENVMVDELRFRTLLPGKTNLTDVVQSALKLFGIYVNRERSALRTNVLRVFNALEEHEHFQAIVDLLNHIPWQDPTRANLPSSELVKKKELVQPHFQWICAEVAVRTCIKQDFQSGCYLWLQEIANWPQSNYVNLESLANILAMGETEAVHLKSHHLALKWFRVLVKITRRHGGRPSLYANALRYALALNTTEGFLAAKQLFYEEISQTELDIQLHRFKLLIAVLDGNQTEAVATWIQLEAQYKKENCLEYEYWEEGLQILEVCTMASLQNQKMIEVAVHCLNAMMLEINKPSLQTSMLVRVIRFHMKVLFKLAVNVVSVETKCVENLISTLISALLMLKESFTSPEGPQDSGGLELWFGDLAWSLGCKLSSVGPFYRFQLFKISYKLLSLTPEKDEQVKEKISMSIILSVAAGINSKSHSKNPHRKILGHCFDLVKARLESCTEKDPHKIVQLYFYEFYILCELGDEKGLWKLLERHRSDVRVKGDHHFFEGLAALASSASQAFLHQILSPFECQQLEEKHKREPKLQAKLTGLAIVCLKESNNILANVVQPSPVKQIVSNWIRIITFSSENIFMQETASTQHRLYCEDYRLFLANHREHFSPSELLMFFNYIWNVTIETRVFKEPKEAHRWLELLKNVACFSSDLQKLYRSLLKDMQIKFQL